MRSRRLKVFRKSHPYACRKSYIFNRLTPAFAGSTRRECWIVMSIESHPRACGKRKNPLTATSFASDPPPRVRETLFYFVFCSHERTHPRACRKRYSSLRKAP